MRFRKAPKIPQSPPVYGTVNAGLRDVYKNNALPLEKDYKFNCCFTPPLSDGDFHAKPSVLLIGQYSTGKTTFIRHLIERDYPGLRIGPEPTTDRFVAIMHGKSDTSIPGNTAVSDPTLPWGPLSDFGNNFLQRFECVHCDSPFLREITLIDTPGILNGDQQTQRGYDFNGVISWFAERVDLILLMFDAHKLDISNEYQLVINSLRGNDQKVRIVLNKADNISSQQLMRTYGALMWSLGKVIKTPEVARVYIGSFWDKPLVNEENQKLFEEESSDLYSDISRVPRRAAIRKINDFIKRIRLLKIHVFIINEVKQNISYLRKERSKNRILTKLEVTFEKISQTTDIPLTDFPDRTSYSKKLQTLDFCSMPKKLNQTKLAEMNSILAETIPGLMKLIPAEEEQASQVSETLVSQKASPFLKQGTSLPNWAEMKYLGTPPDTKQYADDFKLLDVDNEGYVSDEAVRSDLEKSKLPHSVLHRIWLLVDFTNDGFLDLYEYALARQFIEMKLEGFELPTSLPVSLYPSGVRPRYKRRDV